MSKGKGLTEPVVFQTNKLNLRLQIKGSPSELRDPAAAQHLDTKWAIFMDGLFQTEDPEIIQVLDARPDVWRTTDRKAALKAKYGPEKYAQMVKEFAGLSETEVTGSEPSSEEEE